MHLRKYMKVMSFYKCLLKCSILSLNFDKMSLIYRLNFYSVIEIGCQNKERIVKINLKFIIAFIIYFT